MILLTGFCEENRTECRIEMAKLNCFNNEDDSVGEGSGFVGKGFEWIGGSDVVEGVDGVESEDETRRNSQNNFTTGRLYSGSNAVRASDAEHAPKSSSNSVRLNGLFILKFAGAKFQILSISILLMTGNFWKI